MAKLRISELAKELNIKSSEIIGICSKVGIDGKTTHSNTLTDDEAEKVRRFLLRSAVNEVTHKEKVVERDGATFDETRKTIAGRQTIIRRKAQATVAALPTESEPELSVDLPEEAVKIDVQPMPNETVTLEDEVAEHTQDISNADTISEEGQDVSDSAKNQDTNVPDDVSSTSVLEKADDLPELSLEEIARAEHKKEMERLREKYDVAGPKILGKIKLPVAPVPTPKKEREIANVTDLSDKSKKSGKKEKGGDEDDWKKSNTLAKGKVKKKVLIDFRSDYEEGEDGEYIPGSGRRLGKRAKLARGEARVPDINEMSAHKKVIKMEQEIVVSELAKQMQLKSGEIIKKLMSLGVMASINQLIDFDTAELVASEYGYTVNKIGDIEDEIGLLAQIKVEDKAEELKLRPPVVTIMGHVDHGKTSLLDAIRNSAVVVTEAGGITQHIGAYSVTTKSGGQVAFIDTPGHAAFTEMRGRGAKVTDIVVLVVAADDGIMPQTIEAINHAKAAGVPIIVAVNKIDKPSANVEKAKQQLTEYDLIPEDWGGQTIICPVSAKTREGLDNLLDNLALQAEVLELKANPNRPAVGTIIESKVEKGRGPVATVLVQNGTLRKGDAFVAGTTWGKVRAMRSYDGQDVLEATPSIPVEILGSETAPLAGEEFLVISSESEARRISEIRQGRARQKELAHKSGSVGAPLTLDYFASMANDTEKKQLNLIVKADVQGSVEAVAQSLERLSNDEVNVKVLHKAVGAVNENDVQLALASQAILIAFNIRADVRATEMAEKSGVEIRYSRIIYELIESVEKAIKGLRAPVFKETILGRVEVRQTFKLPKIGLVAGCYVLNGTIKRGSKIRLLRDNVVVFEGQMAGLRRVKEDVKEVQAGYECGISIEGFQDLKVGDIMDIYVVEQVVD